jgi:hypothetical protein
MTCTREEKEAYEEFQRNRGDKVILFRMPFAEKMSLTNDQSDASLINLFSSLWSRLSPAGTTVLLGSS